MLNRQIDRRLADGGGDNSGRVGKGKGVEQAATWASDAATTRVKSGMQSPAPLTFSQFQQLIRDRYYKTDSARGTPGTFMWLVEEFGELATALQDNAPGKNPTAEQRANLEEEFADVIAWLTTLANINGVDLEKALGKYTTPGKVEGVKS